jgi:hypothetical protein
MVGRMPTPSVVPAESCAPAAPAAARGTAGVVRGLGRTRWSTAPRAVAARRRGDTVLNWGSPSRGGDVATHAAALDARLRHLRAFRYLVGPAGPELGTGPESMPPRLGPLLVGMTVGVIAGTAGRHPLFSRWLPRPHDGTVAVAGARVTGMADFRVVRRGYTFLMLAPEARAAIFDFLAHGWFDAPAAGDDCPGPDVRESPEGP